MLSATAESSSKAKGGIIGAHDLWIAATALAHGLTPATLNAGEFERVPALSLLPINRST
jgi:tRNA(fMet)-specific endonuclease VapC